MTHVTDVMTLAGQVSANHGYNCPVRFQRDLPWCRSHVHVAGLVGV